MKANFPRADFLRGASLAEVEWERVDFYLVDLRDARYDPKQREDLIHGGAILKAKAV